MQLRVVRSNYTLRKKGKKMQLVELLCHMYTVLFPVNLTVTQKSYYAINLLTWE